MTAERKIAIAMSGGVDSSVAAALLHEAGEQVFGLMLRLSDGSGGPENRCCTPEDIAIARAVAGQIGFPFYVVDARAAFEASVVAPFVRGYAQGITPNPCIQCNRAIRWGVLLAHALAIGATHLATGHYARIDPASGTSRLRAGVDPRKDQSYVLYVLTQEQLAHAVFPLGELTKDQVRNHARRLQLPVAERRESQDLCFVQGDVQAFLAARGVSATPGLILDQQGRPLGQHSGLAGFTLGQRKGLGIAASEALYVLEKDAARNTLTVGPRPAVGRQQFTLGDVNWIAGTPPSMQFEAEVQVRYHAPRVRANIRRTGDASAEVILESRQPDVAPGQSAVFYVDDACLGGGIIQP